MNTTAVRAYIALGSNLENPVLQVQTALKLLGQLPESTFVASSSLYRTAPLGPPDQPHYINAVAAIDTLLSAHELLHQLQQVEVKQGRHDKPIHWGPRILDLDLLLYGTKTINTPNLIIPHPEMKQRNFVLYPLSEIAPDLLFPNKQSLKEILAGLTSSGIERLAKPSEVRPE